MLSFSSTGKDIDLGQNGRIPFQQKTHCNNARLGFRFPGLACFGGRKAVGAFVLCLASAILLHIVFCFISVRRGLLHEHLAARAVGVALDYNLSALRPCNALALQVVV